jgi:hypothetical protein
LGGQGERALSYNVSFCDVTHKERKNKPFPIDRAEEGKRANLMFACKQSNESLG